MPIKTTQANFALAKAQLTNADSDALCDEGTEMRRVDEARATLAALIKGF